MGDDILILFVKIIYTILYICFIIGGILLPIWFVLAIIKYFKQLAKGNDNTHFHFPPWR